jgi:hypothetical protein
VPVVDLPDATSTCGHCHLDQRLLGDRLAIRPHYGDDERNTPAITVLTLKVGG